MEVKELMNPGVVWVEPTATAALAARLLSRHNLGALPVCAGDGRLRGMRQENQHLKEQQEKTDRERRAEAAGRIERLRRQEGELQKVYPDFCWQEEMRREDFGRLILAGVEPRTAYETVHGRELMEKAMRYAAGRTRRQVAGSLASGMGRVAENGGRSIAVTASDPRGLTSEDLADIRRRVLDGEKIRF